MSDLAELLRKAMEHRLADVRTSMPARVSVYNLATQTVDVEPLVREITETDSDDIEEALPVISSVPVSWPRGGGFFITFPLVPGDTGQIVICDRSIDQWRTKGSNINTPGFGFAVDPLDKRKHGLAGAVFYPGLSDSLSPLLDAHALDLVLGKDGGSSIHIKPTGEIHIGSAIGFDPTFFVALADHTHGPGTYAAPGGAVTGASGPSSSNSAKVKAN